MVVAAFNQEKALVGAFSVMVQLCRLIVYSTTKKRSEGEGQLLAGSPVRAPGAERPRQCVIQSAFVRLMVSTSPLIRPALTWS